MRKILIALSIVSLSFPVVAQEHKRCDTFSFSEKVKLGMTEYEVYQVTGCNGRKVTESIYGFGMRYPSGNHLIFQDGKVTVKM